MRIRTIGCFAVMAMLFDATAFPQNTDRQNASTDDIRAEYVRKRLLELYGQAAPADITFVDEDSWAWVGGQKAHTVMEGKAGSKGDYAGVKKPDETAKVNGYMGDRDNHRSGDIYRAGDVTRGVIIGERDGEMYLDKDPCNGKIVTFYGSYRKTKIGTIMCGSNMVDQYEVAQK